MAQSYTKMWDAFLGGEWTGGGEVSEDAGFTDYQEQTEAFYQQVIGPTFIGEGTEFGQAKGEGFEGWYASFDPDKMEAAEEIFRSSIGDPYGSDDPFAWQKVSRYDTKGGIDSRIQQLLEDELYDKGKFLGGETGAEYGTATAKELESYTSGIRGEREALTHGALTSGVGLASGTSGITVRSGENITAAEDVLIEAYKKAETLGSEYRSGTEAVEETLKSDLDDALGVYLKTIDTEKDNWFTDVMRNVQTFKGLGMDTDEVGDKIDLSADPYAKGWGCGYGQEWSTDEGKCVDTTAYEEEMEKGYEFREDAEGVCGIGEIYNKETGVCETRTEYDLSEDSYGRYCPSDDQGLQECGECGKVKSKCWDGAMVCDQSECTDQPDDCTDPDALNYNQPGSCEYGLEDKAETLGDEYKPYDPYTGGIVRGVFGCTDSSANNYNPQATTDDGTCQFSYTSESGEGSVDLTDDDTGDDNGFSLDMCNTSPHCCTNNEWDVSKCGAKPSGTACQTTADCPPCDPGYDPMCGGSGWCSCYKPDPYSSTFG